MDDVSRDGEAPEPDGEDDESSEPQVHNEMSGGTVHGAMLQVDRIDRLIINNPAAEPSGAEQAPPGDQDDIAEAAEKLADEVHKRWEREETRRRLKDPKLLPVRWTTADRIPEDHRDKIPMDHWELIRGRPLERTAPLDLDGELAQIAQVYRAIPTRRLVVAGEAGSGKTSLGLRLVLDLLDTRTPGEPVPEIFSLGSWDPEADTLEAWMGNRLSRDTSGMDAVTADGRTIAAALVDRKLILPVLDGFDEIAEGLQAKALEQLSETTMPLVLTSRTATYASVARGTRALKRAAAIVLTALDPDESKEYLVLGSATAARPEWEHVMAELYDQPHVPANENLREVLGTPLMVSLVRDVYGERASTADGSGRGGPRRPLDLLDTDRFGTRTDIEEHLLSSFVPSAYRRDPRAADTAPPRNWTPQRAQRWLGYLSDHLDRSGGPDLEWWKLGMSMSLRARTAVVSFLAGLSFGLTTAVGNIPVNLIATSHGLGFAIRRGVVVGLLHGLVFGVALGYIYRRADGTEILKPRPVQVRPFGGEKDPGEGVYHKAALGTLLGLGIALAILLIDRLLLPPLGLDDGLGGGLVAAAQFPLTVGLSTGIALALVAWAETSIDVKESVSCADLLRQNRANVVSQILIWALVFGLVAGLGATFTETPLRSLQLGLAFGLEAAFGAGFGYGFCLTAWGQWVALARIWLPLTGRLPWRLVAFLDDACKRDVLRQAGAVYQFRHARLQKHLAGVYRAGRTGAALRGAPRGAPRR
ncbi:NACHT domain-containing protein [Streptomyces acidicola]|uniref:NACHT domain-containing protein n=1 Tax=Streptomyces acidicola TaxID=2596892 RepID=A0A5N8X4V7_9ACTN|nr:NACHT domain-containing protein [Streptomyces acidicola]MPY53535.1 NACHT domain-containing protein [Streptomyces acidicola]